MNKNFLKKISNLCFMAFAIAGLSSCLDNGETVDKQNAIEYATIVKKDSGYKFYLDSGAEATLSGYPTELTNWRRALIAFDFTLENVSQSGGKTNISGGYLDAMGIHVHSILSKQEADEKKVTDNDSIHAYNNLTFWCANGYLTIQCSTPFVSARPDLNLYYIDEEQRADTLAVHAVVNRHSLEAPSSSAPIYGSYKLEPLSSKYNSLDSLTVKLYGKETTPTLVKIAYTDMLEPESKSN